MGRKIYLLLVPNNFSVCFQMFCSHNKLNSFRTKQNGTEQTTYIGNSSRSQHPAHARILSEPSLSGEGSSTCGGSAALSSSLSDFPLLPLPSSFITSHQFRALILFADHCLCHSHTLSAVAVSPLASLKSALQFLLFSRIRAFHLLLFPYPAFW